MLFARLSLGCLVLDVKESTLGRLWPTRYSRAKGAFIDIRESGAIDVVLDSNSDFYAERGVDTGDADAHAAVEAHKAAAARAAAAAATNAERDAATAARDAVAALKARQQERRDAAAAATAAGDEAAAAVGAARTEAAEARASFQIVLFSRTFEKIFGSSGWFRGLFTSVLRRRPFARLKNLRVGR